MSTIQTPSINLIKRLNKVCVFWKSGSLYVAILATLISIVITRIVIRVLNHHRRNRSESEASFITEAISPFDDDFSDLDDDELDASDEDNDDVSDSDSSMEGDEGETELLESDEEVKSKLQRMFSWSDFAKGKSVVKLWDGIGLGLDLNNSSGSLISIYDLDREQRISSIFDKCKFPTVLKPSPTPSTVVITASRTSINAWDSRVKRIGTSIVAEWDEVGPTVKNGNGTQPGLVFRGVKKVYDGESASGVVTVADAGKAGSSVAAAATWWEA